MSNIDNMDSELAKEFIEFAVQKRVKKQLQNVWDVVLLYLTEKDMPYFDLIDFSKDKDRLTKAIEKLGEKTQGEFQDMSDIDEILKDENKDIGDGNE